VQIELRDLWEACTSQQCTHCRTESRTTHIPAPHRPGVFNFEGNIVQRSVQPKSRRGPLCDRRRIPGRPRLLERRVRRRLVPDLRNVQRAIREICIAQPKAKLEARRDVEAVEMAVVDVQPANPNPNPMSICSP
jgi:hypothetical protein